VITQRLPFSRSRALPWWHRSSTGSRNHFANWLFLSLGAGALLLRTALRPIVLAGLVLAFGSTLAIVWELGEYLTFIRTNEDEFATAYTDTLADLTFDLCGSLIAASVTFLAARRHGRGDRLICAHEQLPPGRRPDHSVPAALYVIARNLFPRAPR